MLSTRRIRRRRFLGDMAAATLALPAAATAVAAEVANSASERINLGFIGMGMMGRGHLSRFLGFEDVQVVAVCDVVAERLEDGKQRVEARYAQQTTSGRYQGCAAYVDFRDLLAREDIDAVVISTPDHWHAIPALMAAHVGKDIYCEKPLTHNIAEGRMLVQAVRSNQVVFQTGSQQRSEYGGKFRLACELVRNGRIGQIKTVRVGVGAPAVPCDLPGQEVPAGTDWEFWLGPAPQRPYHEELCPKGIHGHFPAWRRYQEYAGGGLADMGAHHFDIAQWALQMDHSGPVKVEPPQDGARSGLKFTYANGVEMFHGGPSGCTFEGEQGTIHVDRGKIESTPTEILEQPIGEDDRRVYYSSDHRRNWIDSIRNRNRPICDVEIGHRSASVCHLANIAYRLQQSLDWDPQDERFQQEDANRLLSREGRKPWTLS